MMELTSVFDKNRVPLNKVVDKYSELSTGEYITIVHTCLFNQNGEMLIQKRSLNKVDQPGKWDISSGGGVKVGETIWEAAERELYEELGIKYNLSNERVFLTVHYDRGFDDYYLIAVDKNIDEFIIDNEEVLEIKWASQELILAMIQNNEFIKYNEGFIELLFAMFNNRGTYPRKE